MISCMSTALHNYAIYSCDGDPAGAIKLAIEETAEDFDAKLSILRKLLSAECRHRDAARKQEYIHLVESEDFLATTGRCNRRWDGRQLEMTQATVITDAWVMAAMILSQSHMTVHTCGKKFVCDQRMRLRLFSQAYCSCFPSSGLISRSVATPTISGGSRDRIASRNCWDSISAIRASV